MFTALRIAVLACALAVAPGLAVAATTWQIDPVHTTLEFKVKHLMVAWVKGSFATFAGTLVTDEADLSRSTGASSV